MTAIEICVTASVASEEAHRALKRLCKHFSHKVTASWTEAEGRVEFAMGTCDMQATDETLTFTCKAPSRDELAEITETIDRHLVNFLKQADAGLSWRLL